MAEGESLNMSNHGVKARRRAESAQILGILSQRLEPCDVERLSSRGHHADLGLHLALISK